MARSSKAILLALTGLAAVALAFAAGRVDPNNPTGSHGLIVIDKIGRHIRFFDPSTFQEISSVEVGVAPHDVAISPDHKFAYIPVYGDGVYGRNPHPGHNVAIIDLASRKVAGMIDVSPYQAPHGIQIDDAGRSTSLAISAASCWSSIRKPAASKPPSTPKAPATGPPYFPTPAKPTSSTRTTGSSSPSST